MIILIFSDSGINFSPQARHSTSPIRLLKRYRSSSSIRRCSSSISPWSASADFMSSSRMARILRGCNRTIISIKSPTVGRMRRKGYSSRSSYSAGETISFVLSILSNIDFFPTVVDADLAASFSSSSASSRASRCSMASSSASRVRNFFFALAITLASRAASAMRCFARSSGSVTNGLSFDIRWISSSSIPSPSQHSIGFSACSTQL
mmetsp:Transcript_23372/g.50480  ORF Transcript_23372/g.50480 Transcript_23372/m.50480 type:complete len:207 (+) Transcript_23372:545-1165(+)